MSRDYLLANNTISELTALPVNLQEAKHLVIERARELVNEPVKQRGRGEPPFLAEELARLRGVKKIVKADLGEQSGFLLRLQDGYIVKVNAKHSQVRQNYSCAHEIGHILLDEVGQQDFLRDTEWRGGTGITGTDEERLCNIAAAELLMPEPVFKEYLARFGLSVNRVELLAHTFRVSIPATTIRIAEVSREPCIAILWRPWRRGESHGLRIGWYTGPGRESSNDKQRYAPVSTYVGRESALFKAYQGQGIVKSFKLFELGKIRKRCHIESKGFGRNENRYVTSLALPDR